MARGDRQNRARVIGDGAPSLVAVVDRQGPSLPARHLVGECKQKRVCCMAML